MSSLTTKLMRKGELDLTNDQEIDICRHDDGVDSLDSHDMLLTHYWNKKCTYGTEKLRKIKKIQKDQNLRDDQTIDKENVLMSLPPPEDDDLTQLEIINKVEHWKEINKKEIDKVLHNVEYKNQIFRDYWEKSKIF